MATHRDARVSSTRHRRSRGCGRPPSPRSRPRPAAPRRTGERQSAWSAVNGVMRPHEDSWTGRLRWRRNSEILGMVSLWALRPDGEPDVAGLQQKLLLVRRADQVERGTRGLRHDDVVPGGHDVEVRHPHLRERHRPAAEPQGVRRPARSPASACRRSGAAVRPGNGTWSVAHPVSSWCALTMSSSHSLSISPAYCASSAVGFISRKYCNSTCGGMLRSSSSTSSTLRSPRLSASVSTPASVKSTGVAIVVRLASGRSGSAAAASR